MLKVEVERCGGWACEIFFKLGRYRACITSFETKHYRKELAIDSKFKVVLFSGVLGSNTEVEVDS
jgi:hypothetical protein